MENPSLSVPKQNAIFASEPETFKSPSSALPALAMRANGIARGAIRHCYFPFNTDRTIAFAVSFFLHAVMATALYAFALNALPSRFSQDFQAIEVTWADAPRLSEKGSLASHVSHPPVPVRIIPSMPDSRDKKALPENRTILSYIEESTSDSVLKNPEQTPTGQATGDPAWGASQKDYEGKRIAAQEQSIKISGQDPLPAYTSMAKPRYRENKLPVYPYSALIRGYEGVVLISAEILPEGQTGKLTIKSSSGYDILDQSAIEAVKAWKFDPARKMGKPVIAWVDIPIRFVLKNNP